VIVFTGGKLSKFANFMSLILRTFLKRIYFPTNAPRDTKYIPHIKTPTCFGTQMPSAGNYYNKVVQTNLLIYVLFISSIKTLVVKLHKIKTY
jgi:hypothetical protein